MRNTYNGQGKMWWYPTHEDLENQDDLHAQTYTGAWIDNKHQGEGVYYWPHKKQTFRGGCAPPGRCPAAARAGPAPETPAAGVLFETPV